MIHQNFDQIIRSREKSTVAIEFLVIPSNRISDVFYIHYFGIILNNNAKMWPRFAKIYRSWPIYIFVATIVFIILICSRNKQKGNNYDEDYVSLRLLKDQKDYIDRRGIHVVVGHYIGDSVDPLKTPNVTKDIINKNMFDPQPREGRNGEPVIISSKNFHVMQQLFQINRFNLMASDRIPLNRTLPDVRKKKCIARYSGLSDLPKTSIIIVFHNEAWSTLLRTVQSVIDRSPRHLLTEIILVDDNSDREFLKGPLDDYVKKLKVSTRVLRSDKRVGLINARLFGANEATGEILTFLDAHCECTVGWLEPLLEAISKNRTRVVSPVIDIINDDTFGYTRSFELHWGAFNWDLHFRWLTLNGPLLRERRENIVDPFKTPAMAGGLFAMDKDYFFELGSYDDQMQIWGGENLELSFRVWQCGGSVEIAPCSHVGHLFRKSSPYTFPGGVGDILYGNLARVALVWLDDWAEFYFKFNPVDSIKCDNWMTVNLYDMIIHVPTMKCLMKPLAKGMYAQPSGYAIYEPCVKSPTLSQMFVMGNNGVVMTDESVCLDAPERDTRHEKPKVKIMACSGLHRQKWHYNKDTKALVHVSSGMCLHVSPDTEEGPVIASCNGNVEQQWIMESVSWK